MGEQERWASQGPGGSVGGGAQGRGTGTPQGDHQPGRPLGDWPPGAAVSQAGTSATGPQARQAPRGLAPQPGGHLGHWPPRAAVSRAGTSGTGPPGLPLAGQASLGAGGPSSSHGRRTGAAGGGTHGSWRWPFLGGGHLEGGAGSRTDKPPSRDPECRAPRTGGRQTADTQVPTGFG